MTEHYNQFFYVPIAKRHLFRYINAWRYLPPLELPPLVSSEEAPTSTPNNEQVYQNTAWSTRQWDIVDQLRNEVKYLHAEVNKLRAKRKEIYY